MFYRAVIVGVLLGPWSPPQRARFSGRSRSNGLNAVLPPFNSTGFGFLPWVRQSALALTREATEPYTPSCWHRPSTYRLPPRYTLHDSKRLTFVADLANPAVPLHKLSKSIPHGFKGVELLEMLWANGVSLERGVWFVKVIGASEMVSPSLLSPISRRIKRASYYSVTNAFLLF